MGMFDYLKCERVMPDGYDGRANQFQTKDFECAMVEYQISPEGRLLQPIWHSEEVPKNERPYPNNDGLLGICGSLRIVVEKMHDMNYHGIVHFYDYNSKQEWHGYLAKFTEGQLVSIECDSRTGIKDE